MDFFGLCLIISSVGLFITSFVLIATGHAYGFPISGLSFFSFGFLAFIIGIFMMRFTFRLCLKRLKISHFLFSNKISELHEKKQTIIFYKKNSGWVCDAMHDSIFFDLKFCLFKKSFVLAFVTRAVRYPLVSNKLPISSLGRHSLLGFDKKQIINVAFQHKMHKKQFILVRNCCSKCSLISQLIIKSKLPPVYEHHKPSYESLGKKVLYVDEEIYINYL